MTIELILISNSNEIKHSLFVSHTPKNLQIPTLGQIHSALAKTLIENRIEKTRKKLDEHKNNEIKEMESKYNKLKSQLDSIKMKKN